MRIIAKPWANCETGQRATSPSSGKESGNPYQLQPYVSTPAQQAALQRLIEFYTYTTNSSR